MAVLLILTPESAQFPSTNFAALTSVNATENVAVLAFDAGTSENCRWRFVMPTFTGALTARVKYIMASAVANLVDFEISLQAVTPADAFDIDAGTSYAAVNSNSGTVPATAGYMGEVAVTLTNNDSIAAGDWVSLNLGRDADDATNDTATGDCYVLAVTVEDTL